MAKEYIEREAAIIGLAASSLTPHQIDDAAEAIKLVPAADVVERKKGKWIRPVPGDGEPHCSECKAEAPLSCGRFLHHEYTNFCPNCGADLREDTT